MKCQRCGAAVTPESDFCQKCGAPLKAAAGAKGDKPGPPNTTQPVAGAAAGSSGAGVEESSGQGGGFSRRGRGPDPPEQVLWEAGYSPKAMVGSWAVAAVVSVIVLVLTIIFWGSLAPWGWVPLVGIALLWLALLAWLFYTRLNVHYRLTNQRLFHERGVLRRETNRIEVINIDDVAFNQGIFDRMFGTGRIEITSSDRSDPVLKLEGIDDVHRVSDLIDGARRAERLRRGMSIEAI